MFEPSENQQNIFNAWNNEDCNVLVNAVAGSGKSTTLLELLGYCDARTLFLSFNKSVQEETQQKIEARSFGQGKAMTMHSLGLSAIKKHYRGYTIKNGKNFDLIKKVQTKNKPIFDNIRWQEKLKISYSLMDMNDISRLFLTNDIEEIKVHLTSMDKSMHNSDYLPQLWEDFISIRESSYIGNYIQIDFTDMMYLPVYKQLQIPIDPVYLMIDECQDLNLCQHTLIDNLINQGTVKKWIAVGDRNQAIYGFSGASTSSFDMFLEKGETKEFPLDICYRCSTAIIDEANDVFDVMEYSSEEEGLVKTINDSELIKDNSMIICRNSGPLISLYFKILGEGKTAYIKGSDILNSINRFLKPYNSYTTSAAKDAMEMKLKELEEKKGEEGRMYYFMFKENFNNFKLLYKHLCEGNETIDFLIKKVSSLFISQDNAIMLCTIHKSKGLEADIVYILNESLIPSKFAKSEEQLKQEQNLKYVARTRAKKELYYLNL